MEINHSHEAIAKYPAPDQDAIFITDNHASKYKNKRLFKNGKDYAVACRWTNLMRSVYDAWAFHVGIV